MGIHSQPENKTNHTYIERKKEKDYYPDQQTTMSTKVMLSPITPSRTFDGFQSAKSWNNAIDLSAISTPTPLQQTTATPNIPNTPCTQTIFNMIKTPTTDHTELNLNFTPDNNVFSLNPVSSPTKRVVNLPTQASNNNSLIARKEETLQYPNHKLVVKHQIEVVPTKKVKRENLLVMSSPVSVCKNLQLEYNPVKQEAQENRTYSHSSPVSPVSKQKVTRKTPKPNQKTLKEKKFQCEHTNKDGQRCTMRFYRQDELRRHERTHTGEKPFKCPHAGCDRWFARSDHVRTHVRIHTGEKPYNCKFCDKSFARSDERLRHHKVHEKRQKKEADAKEFQASQRARINQVSGNSWNSAPASVCSQSPPPPYPGTEMVNYQTVYQQPPVEYYHNYQPVHHTVQTQMFVPMDQLTHI